MMWRRLPVKVGCRMVTNWVFSVGFVKVCLLLVSVELLFGVTSA